MEGTLQSWKEEVEGKAGRKRWKARCRAGRKRWKVEQKEEVEGTL
jgi:hypothetical protein